MHFVRLLSSLTDVALSSGAACSSASAEPSHVLMAIGRTEAEAKASLRFGLCRGTSEADVDFLVETGIDSMSLNPDSVVEVKRRVAETEERLAAVAGRVGLKRISVPDVSSQPTFPSTPPTN